MAACKNTKCGAEVAITERFCPSCYCDNGYPNVKIAESEGDALTARVERARSRVRKQGRAPQLDELFRTLQLTHAVVNVDVDFLFNLVKSGKTLHATYSEQVAGGTRRVAERDADCHRTSVEGILFGSCARNIHYAALSSDGRGLTSYGDAWLELKDAMIAHRASLLEENSYRFVERHRLVPGGQVPAGYRAVWPRRTDLGIAKLADKVKRQTRSKDHSRMILNSRPTRQDDDFIEVHIFGPFDRNTVESIRTARTLTQDSDSLMLEAAREEAAKVGIPWK